MKRKQFLCSECLEKIRKHDADRQQKRRKLKIKVVVPQVGGKIKINYDSKTNNS